MQVYNGQLLSKYEKVSSSPIPPNSTFNINDQYVALSLFIFSVYTSEIFIRSPITTRMADETLYSGNSGPKTRSSHSDSKPRTRECQFVDSPRKRPLVAYTKTFLTLQVLVPKPSQLTQTGRYSSLIIPPNNPF